jgi:putative membrane protein
MVALIKWRLAVHRGTMPDTQRAAGFARISMIQSVLVVAMVLAATAMARGLGTR